MKQNKVRLAERRASAAVRQAAAALLTPQQKLAKLDQSFGVGVGAKRERARLAEQIKTPRKPITKEVAEAISGVPETKVELAVSKKTRPQRSNARKDSVRS